MRRRLRPARPRSSGTRVPYVTPDCPIRGQCGTPHALDALLTRAKSLGNEQEVLTGRLREITRLRQEAQRESNEMRSRVAALLRGKLGFKNETLLGFGVPLRKRGRRTTPEKNQPAPQPGPAEPVSPEPAG